MELKQFIQENIIILIPVLYFIGSILKGTEAIKDKYIPVILLPIGVGLCSGIMGFTVDAIVQGILVVGASVYGNQLVKQLTEK